MIRPLGCIILQWTKVYLFIVNNNRSKGVMNILLFHPQKEVLDITRFCLESEINLVVLQASTFQETMDILLEENAVDLIISSQQPTTDKLFKYLLSTSAEVPIILINDTAELNMDVYPDLKIIGSVHSSKVPHDLVPLINKHFSEILKNSENSDYCRIQTSLLLRVVPLKGDIFIRLSNVKYVKLFKTGAVFSQEDLEKYLVRKKVAFLYVKKNEASEFAEKFKQDIVNLVANADPTDPNLGNTVAEVQDVIQELTLKIGFTPEIQAIAKSNVDLAIKAVGTNPKLSKVLAASPLSSKNYISSHSMLLANIACSIAAQMEWPSDTTFQKLILASLFHDFVFTDPNLARISTKKQIESNPTPLTPEQIKFVETHPIKSADVIKSMDEIPSDVDIIVLQHHERPNGTGFPKGLRSNQIAPLASVFIVAHDIVDELTSASSQFDLKKFLKNTEALYQNATFKKIWKTLSNPETEKTTASATKKPAA